MRRLHCSSWGWGRSQRQPFRGCRLRQGCGGQMVPLHSGCKMTPMACATLRLTQICPLLLSWPHSDSGIFSLGKPGWLRPSVKQSVQPFLFQWAFKDGPLHYCTCPGLSFNESFRMDFTNCSVVLLIGFMVSRLGSSFKMGSISIIIILTLNVSPIEAHHSAQLKVAGVS